MCFFEFFRYLVFVGGVQAELQEMSRAESPPPKRVGSQDAMGTACENQEMWLHSITSKTNDHMNNIMSYHDYLRLSDCLAQQWVFKYFMRI